MEIIRKTHCPRCNGSLHRRERITFAGGMWPKRLTVVYACDSCPYENNIVIKLNKKMKKRLRERLRLT